MPDYGDFPTSVLGKPVFDKDRRIRDLEDENVWLRNDIATPLRNTLASTRRLLVSLLDDIDDSETVNAAIDAIDDVMDMCRIE